MGVAAVEQRRERLTIPECLLPLACLSVRLSLSFLPFSPSSSSSTAQPSGSEQRHRMASSSSSRRWMSAERRSPDSQPGNLSQRRVCDDDDCDGNWTRNAASSLPLRLSSPSLLPVHGMRSLIQGILLRSWESGRVCDDDWRQSRRQAREAGSRVASFPRVSLSLSLSLSCSCMHARLP